MNIDFSWSIQKWVDFIKEFLDVIVNFFSSFKDVDIKIFADDEG